MSYKLGTSQLHRPLVAAADGSAPATADKLKAMSSYGYDGLLFSLVYLSGGGTAGFTVVPYLWNPTLAIFEQQVQQSKAFTGDDNYSYFVTTYGRPCFLRVTAITGTAPTLSIYGAVANAKPVTG